MGRVKGRAAIAASLFVAVLATTVTASGCLGGRPVGYVTVASGSVTGLAAGYSERLEPLLGRRQAMLLASENEWAPLRDLLNSGAGLALYGHVDFGNRVLVAYFSGPAESSAHRLELQSATARGNKVRLGFQLLKAGRTADPGYPYQIVALDLEDLWPAGPAREPRHFEFTVSEGRLRAATIGAELTPPPDGATRSGPEVVRVVGAGSPHGWAPGGEAVVVSMPETVDSGARGTTGLYAVPLDGARGARAALVTGQDTVHSARFSPGGSLLAFMARGDAKDSLSVLRIRAGDAQPTELDLRGLLPLEYSWSPDGSQIAVLGCAPQSSGGGFVLAVAAAAGGEGVRPLFSQQKEIRDPAWTAGGCIFCLRQTSQGTVLSRLGVPGIPTGDLVVASEYTVTGDGSCIAFVDETGAGQRGLYVAGVTGHAGGGIQARLVASGLVAGPVISGDGAYVAYCLAEPGSGDGPGTGPDVWVSCSEGQGAWRLTGGAAARPIAFSPDGRRLLIELLPAGASPEAGALAAVAYFP